MNQAEALEALQFHSGSHPDIESPRWANGFLGSLRPYQGQLNITAMRELELVLRTLAPILQQGERLPREPLSDFLAVIGYGQYWALSPEGMLRRNGLMEEKDVHTLTAWLAGFSLAFQMIIAGEDIDSAMGMMTTLEPLDDGA